MYHSAQWGFHSKNRHKKQKSTSFHSFRLSRNNNNNTKSLLQEVVVVVCVSVDGAFRAFLQQGATEDGLGERWCQMSLAYFWVYLTLAQRRATTAATARRAQPFQTSADTSVSKQLLGISCCFSVFVISLFVLHRVQLGELRLSESMRVNAQWSGCCAKSDATAKKEKGDRRWLDFFPLFFLSLS